jgi:NADPH:quinone reductase-like Zn-dependent oxidoreductase
VLAAFANEFHPEDPTAGLVVGDRSEPSIPDGWALVNVRATAVNHHDLWSLQGVGLKEDQLPMILGCDAAGVDDQGNEVIVHSVISDPDWRGDETLDPRRSLLSERYPGTFAECVAVPRRNLVPKPPELSFEEAACLPTAWLTAYRMLFVNSGLLPGQTVLVQGASGGVASAAIVLGRAAGFRVWATSRDEAKRDFALQLGADQAFATDERLPARVDAVIETVGDATWSHSLRSLKPGGTIVIAGATTGPNPEAGLNRIFFLQHRIVGSTMGTRDELEALSQMLVLTGIRPPVQQVFPLSEAADALRLMSNGETRGKIVLRAPDRG